MAFLFFFVLPTPASLFFQFSSGIYVDVLGGNFSVTASRCCCSAQHFSLLFRPDRNRAWFFPPWPFTRQRARRAFIFLCSARNLADVIWSFPSCFAAPCSFRSPVHPRFSVSIHDAASLGPSRRLSTADRDRRFPEAPVFFFFFFFFLSFFFFFCFSLS